MARAYRLADVTLVVPLDFLRLPLIAVVGVLFYAEPLQPAVLLGAVVMCCGIYYSVQRETRQRAG
jgi:drug/metabolite transporter (DMT)-like permease